MKQQQRGIRMFFAGELFGGEADHSGRGGVNALYGQNPRDLVGPGSPETVCLCNMGNILICVMCNSHE